MKPEKKPRIKASGEPESPLRTLPEERQAAIIELLKKNSTVNTRKELIADGLTVSTGALSEFWSWWHLRRQFKQTQSDVQTLMEDLRTQKPGLSEGEIFAHGQKVFSLLAMKNESAEDWSRIQKTRQREELIKIERQKFQRETCELFLKWQADEEAKKIATSSASNKEKIEALGKKMFGEDWE